ncbi:MAG: translation initiation factor IF-3 [Oscillospiraceae bacterium]|nr:translation initiation factor IF-3 [Oscillospiraceae bacterium]
MDISVRELQINEEIRDKEVRLVGLEGQQDAVVPTEKAMLMASEMNLDLIKIAPNATPPVCKIMDYGKYCFEQTKREREARKKQKTVEVKEIRLSMGIGTGDLATKVGSAVKFLKAGSKVKVVVRFRGREMVHIKMGETLLKRFAQECAEYGTAEGFPKAEGRSMIMFIVAKR